MKRGSMIAVLSLLFVPAAANSSQQSAEPLVKQTSVVGLWHGKMDELPAVELAIKEDGSKLAGTVVFYRVTDEGNGPKVSGKAELTLIDPKFDGSTLAFSFKRKDGVLARAQMKMTSDHEGVLKLLNDPPVEEPMTVTMVRDK